VGELVETFARRLMGRAETISRKAAKRFIRRKLALQSDAPKVPQLISRGNPNVGPGRPQLLEDGSTRNECARAIVRAKNP
jgi:hypothetical protein